MIANAAIPFLAPADSARAVATVYTVSLLATLPVVTAAAAAVALRRASARNRVLVWRAAIVALLVMLVGRLLPVHAAAWAVPSALAGPLVALGRLQVTGSTLHLARLGGGGVRAATGGELDVVSLLFVAYLIGVIVALLPTLAGSIRVRLLAGRARVVDEGWLAALRAAQSTLDITRRVRLVASPHVAVPMTWGVVRPMVIVPESALDWNSEQRRIVLLHELSHVRTSDWAFGLLGRAVCALYWFHPGAWWIARQLRDDCERACDDQVIAAGIARSAYAELLIAAADQLFGRSCEPALALSGRRGLRGRLSAILDSSHDVIGQRGRGLATSAAFALVAASVPVSSVELAPTREVLTHLMTDARWESRAYAVIGLAQRADSVAVARTAAERDPSPRVRAWARYALRQRRSAAAERDTLQP